jgi:hypothetical protein
MNVGGALPGIVRAAADAGRQCVQAITLPPATHSRETLVFLHHPSRPDDAYLNQASVLIPDNHSTRSRNLERPNLRA